MGYIFSKITYLFYLLEYDQLPYRFLTCLFSYVGTFLFLDFPQPGIFVDTRLALQPQNLYKRKMKESLAFTYFSLHLHLSPDKTLQRHTYFICTTMFSFYVFLMSKSTKSFKKHGKRKLSILFSLCLKEEYISKCKFIVNKKNRSTFFNANLSLKKTGQHKSIQVCLHFNWCAPTGKIENMHRQCSVPFHTSSMERFSENFDLKART